MKKFVKVLILGIFAGIAIAFGGLVYLVCVNYGQKVLGSFLFSVGLLIVCGFGLNLYTGKIGYVLSNKKQYLIDLAIMYLGNIIGAAGFGALMRAINVGGDSLKDTVETVSNNKLLLLDDGGAKSWYYLLITGFFCGVLVFLAVDMFKKENVHACIKVIMLILCVGTFIVCGFEHCVADMFYFGFSGSFVSNDWLRAILSIILITIGNSLGSITFYSGLYLLKA